MAAKKEYSVLILKAGTSLTSVITKNSAGVDTFFELSSSSQIHQYSDCAVFYSKEYENIFGKKAKESSMSDQLTSIMKIKIGDKTIYRKFRSVAGMTSGYMALSIDSLWNLGTNAQNSNLPTAEVEKANCFDKLKFYWYHPELAVRISTKFSVVSIGLAVLSLIFGIVSLF